MSVVLAWGHKVGEVMREREMLGRAQLSVGGG